MKYYPRNEAAIKAEYDALEKKANEWANNENVNMLYLNPGTTMVRILPEYSEAGMFFHKYIKHHISVGNVREIFACPNSFGLPCPICAKGEELMGSRNEEKMKFARENLKPSEKYLYNALCYAGPPNPKNGEVPEFGKVYVLEAGIIVQRGILALDQDSLTGWANVTNPENGVILVINRSGKGQFNTKYTVNPHGGGRTNLFEDCAARGVNPQDLQLVNLEQVPVSPPDWKLEELASSIDKIVGGGFSSTPTPRPVLPTVSPAAAAAASVAPVESAPVPGAALPQVPQWPQAPVSTPSQPGVPPAPVAPPVAPPGAPQVPQVPPPPGYMAPQTGYVALDTISGPSKAPSIPAPPNDDGEIPF